MADSGQKRTLFTLFSIVVIDLIGFGIVIPVLPFYAEEYGANAAVLGLLISCFAAMQFIFAPIWGRLSDRIGRRPVMLITIAGTSAAFLLLGYANSLVWLFVARIFGGIFGGNIGVATAYVTDITSSKDRTKWMGMIGASFGIGFILGPAIGGLLSTYGLGVPMFAGAILAAINLVYANIVLREPKRHEVESRVPDGHVLKNPFILRMCILYSLFTIGMTQLEATFAFFMMDRFQYDAQQVAYILVMMALIMVGIQGGAIRRLAKAFGERNLLMAGALILCVAFFAIPWQHVVGFLLIPLAISAVGRGIAQPSMLSMVSHATMASNRGKVMGIFQSSASLGRVIGPLLAGVLYDSFMSAPYWFASALMLVVMALGATLPSHHEVKIEDAELALE